MLVVVCPNCRWPLLIPEQRVTVDQQCPDCGAFYHVGRSLFLSNKDRRRLDNLVRTARSLSLNREENPSGSAEAIVAPPPPAPPATPELPKLTSAHLCQHCEGTLPAVGVRRTLCNCPHCERPASVYAILHHCPECDAWLESPRQHRGKYGCCPVCKAQITIPTDVLFNDEGETPDESWFSFLCPSCAHQVLSPRQHAHLTAVCPSCQRALTVPAGGQAVVTGGPRPAQDASSPLTGMLTHPCPRCRQLVPVGARICRACGQATS